MSYFLLYFFFFELFFTGASNTFGTCIGGSWTSSDCMQLLPWAYSVYVPWALLMRASTCLDYTKPWIVSRPQEGLPLWILMKWLDPLRLSLLQFHRHEENSLWRYISEDKTERGGGKKAFVPCLLLRVSLSGVRLALKCAIWRRVCHYQILRIVNRNADVSFPFTSWCAGLEKFIFKSTRTRIH